MTPLLETDAALLNGMARELSAAASLYHRLAIYADRYPAQAADFRKQANDTLTRVQFAADALAKIGGVA